MNTVRFHPAAVEEMTAAARYYDECAHGLGDLFLNEIEAAANLVASAPEAFPVTSPGVRKLAVIHFPFNVYYVVQAQNIVILAIAHQHRKPGYWKGRRRGDE